MNFAVWATGGIYPLTADGPGQDYINAIPFYRNSILSDLTYSVVLFGGYFAWVRFRQYSKGDMAILNATA